MSQETRCARLLEGRVVGFNSRTSLAASVFHKMRSACYAEDASLSRGRVLIALSAQMIRSNLGLYRVDPTQCTDHSVARQKRLTLRRFRGAVGEPRRGYSGCESRFKLHTSRTRAARLIG